MFTLQAAFAPHFPSGLFWSSAGEKRSCSDGARVTPRGPPPLNALGLFAASSGGQSF